jgi:hypothetical protein
LYCSSGGSSMPGIVPRLRRPGSLVLRVGPSSGTRVPKLARGHLRSVA